MEEKETNTESDRKLGSIQLVDSIEKHFNADSLEIVTVLGWKVVTRIGEVKKGDKVIYCEIDSMLPGDAEWLPPAVKGRVEKQKDKKWFRVKTIKLRGQISQGLIIPIVKSLSDKFNNIEINADLTDFGITKIINLRGQISEGLIVPIIKSLSDKFNNIGADVTDLLGITKYEPPALGGKYKNKIKDGSGIKFPAHLLGKTDESRVQSKPKLLKALQGKEYYMTVKMDGTSGTFVIDPETQELLVCSRNLVRPKPDNLSVCPYWYIANKYNIKSKLENYPHLAIQGEICGPNIQKNLLKLGDLKLYVFNIVDTVRKTKLGFLEMLGLCSELDLETAPIEEFGDRFDYDIDELLEKAEGTYKNTKSQREGLVVRSIDQNISFKVINNRYLLKHGY